jgi:hypothetical protein
MKAGTALGLLAGLGAMNAMSGKPYGGKRFTGLMDMLDGGGAGQSGDKFEGGGLLSMLGNLFMKPMQAQQNVERIASDTAATKAATDVLKKMAEGGTPTARLDGKDGLGYDYNSQDIYGIGAGGEYGGLPVPDVLGSTEGLLAAQSINEGLMGLDPFGGSMTPMEKSDIKANAMYSGRSDAYMPAVNVNVANDAQPVSEQTILPSDGARVDAQNQANRDRMRQNMATVTREQYDQMSRQEKAALGLPVGGLDLTFAGADAFKQPMQYSGRGTSSGDPEFDEFMRLAANDSSLVGMIDNPVAMRNVFNMYKDIRSGTR